MGQVFSVSGKYSQKDFQESVINNFFYFKRGGEKRRAIQPCKTPERFLPKKALSPSSPCLSAQTFPGSPYRPPRSFHEEEEGGGGEKRAPPLARERKTTERKERASERANGVGCEEVGGRFPPPSLRFLSTRSNSSRSNSRLQPGTNASPRPRSTTGRPRRGDRQSPAVLPPSSSSFFGRALCNSLPPPWPAQATSLFPVTSRRASLAAFLSRSVSIRPARVGCPFREVWELPLPRCSSLWGSASFPAARRGARAWRCECRRRREKGGGGGAEEREKKEPPRSASGAQLPSFAASARVRTPQPWQSAKLTGGSKVVLLLPLLAFWAPRTTEDVEGGNGVPGGLASSPGAFPVSAAEGRGSANRESSRRSLPLPRRDSGCAEVSQGSSGGLLERTPLKDVCPCVSWRLCRVS